MRACHHFLCKGQSVGSVIHSHWFSSSSFRHTFSLAAMLFHCVVHPKGLDPFQAAKAWHLRKQEGLPWKVVRFQVHTMSGTHPGMDAVQDAVGRVEAQRRTSKFRKAGVASSGYARCGRTPLLSSEQKKAVIAFVKRWHHKRFCTANGRRSLGIWSSRATHGAEPASSGANGFMEGRPDC